MERAKEKVNNFIEKIEVTSLSFCFYLCKFQEVFFVKLPPSLFYFCFEYD